MNAFHLNSRNLRYVTNVLVFVAIGCVAFISLRALTSSAAISISSSHDGSHMHGDPNSIVARLKFGAPDADGKVKVVISMEAADLAPLLDRQRYDSARYDVGAVGPAELTPNVSVILQNSELCGNVSALKYIVQIGHLQPLTNALTCPAATKVMSKPSEQARRDVLRQTWANPRLFKGDVSRLVFFIGRAPNDGDETLQALVKSEFELHGDIVQGDFIDTERNGTLKSVMGLRWIADHCPQAAYVIKANDDTFVDIFELLRVMDRHRRSRLAMLCPLWKDNTMPILRDPAVCGIWCVKPGDLPGRTHFPQYCASVLSVVSRELVGELLRETRSTPFFWISDVYVTGMLTRKISKAIHYIDLLGSLSLNWNLVEKQYLNTPGRGQPAISITQVDDVLKAQKLWRSVLRRLPTSNIKLLSDAVIGQLP